MTNGEKRKFINDLVKNVKKDVLAKVPNMPQEWDGIELRQYLSDKFRESAYLTYKNQLSPALKRRRKNYENEVVVRNL